MAPRRRGVLGSAAAATALLAAAGLAPRGALAGHVKKRGKEEGPGWRMMHHSFERVLTYDDTLADWLLSASSMALRDRVQLLPPVRDRHGLFWSKKAVETRDFEVTFTLSATDNGEGKEGPQDGFVAFWLGLDHFAGSYQEQVIVQEPSKDWHKGLEATGLTFLGNRPTFKGLVVAFVLEDRQHTKAEHNRQLAAALWSDGSKPLALQDLLTQDTGAQKIEKGWMTSGTQVKVRVFPDGHLTGSVMTLDVLKFLPGSLWGWAPDGVDNSGMLSFQADGKVKWNDGEAQGRWEALAGNRLSLTFNGGTYVLRCEGSHRAVVEEPQQEPRPAMLLGGKDLGAQEEDWQVVFSFPTGTIPLAAEFFMGFSGWTGSASYIEVDVHRIETVNFDATTIGEDEADVLKEKEKLWMEVLKSEMRFVSQASQAEAVVRLTKLLSEHVDEYDRAGEKIREDLVNMEERLDTLGSDLSTYLAAAQAFSFEAQQFDPQVVRDHIVGISSVLARGKEAHDAKLVAVHEAAKVLKASGSGSRLTEESKVKVQGVQETAMAMEHFAAKGSAQTNLLLLIMVVSVAGLGFLFLSRMRYYEKKHYI